MSEFLQETQEEEARILSRYIYFMSFTISSLYNADCRAGNKSCATVPTFVLRVLQSWTLTAHTETADQDISLWQTARVSWRTRKSLPVIWSMVHWVCDSLCVCILTQSFLFTGVIAGGVTGLALAAALAAILIYTWQKKDNGGYILGQQRASDEGYHRPNREEVVVV